MRWTVILSSIFYISSTRASIPGPPITPSPNTSTQYLTGHIDPSQVLSFVYVPFVVPENTTFIYVFQNYTGRGQGSVVDLGLFDQRGYDPNTLGFRGWSGGFRTNFTISPMLNVTTPAYIPGYIIPGTWNVILGPYTSQAQGIDYNLTLQLSTSTSPPDPTYKPNFAPQSISNTVKKYYRGDLHLHTVYSDGRRTPDELVNAALSRQLDFIFSTEHNTQSANLMWGEFKDRGILIGRGEEVTTRHGHWGALGLDEWQWIDWRYNPGDANFKTAVDNVHASNGFAIANHPFAPCSACIWEFGYDYMDAIEVWNGPYEYFDDLAVAYWQKMLVNGSKITAVGASDAHNPADVVGLPHTVIKSDSLATTDLISGMKKRNCYILAEPTMDLSFVISDTTHPVLADIGDNYDFLSSQYAYMNITVTGMPKAKVNLIDQSGILFSQNTTSSGTVDIKFPIGFLASQFVRIEVRNITNNVMFGMTNPIWFNR